MLQRRVTGRVTRRWLACWSGLRGHPAHRRSSGDGLGDGGRGQEHVQHRPASQHVLEMMVRASADGQLAAELADSQPGEPGGADPENDLPAAGPEHPQPRHEHAGHRSACAARIERALGRLPGVASASVNLARGFVSYDGAAINAGELCRTVAGAGYTAEALEAATAPARLPHSD